MVAVPEVGGYIPVKTDLGETGEKKTDISIFSLDYRYTSMGIYVLFGIHSGGLSSSIVPQKGSNLALVETHGEAIHSRSEATTEHLDQVLDADTLY